MLFLYAVSYFDARYIFDTNADPGVSPNSTALIVGRAIAGLGGAGIASGAYAIIAFAVHPQRRAAFTGLMGSAYGIASVIGPLLGGVFAEKVS